MNAVIQSIFRRKAAQDPLIFHRNLPEPANIIFEIEETELYSNEKSDVHFNHRIHPFHLNYHVLNQEELDSIDDPYKDLSPEKHISVIKKASRREFIEKAVEIRENPGYFVSDPRKSQYMTNFADTYSVQSEIPKIIRKHLPSSTYETVHRELNNSRNTIVTVGMTMIGNEREFDRHLEQIETEHGAHNFFQFWTRTNLVICEKSVGYVITKEDTEDVELVGWMVYFPPVPMYSMSLINLFNPKNYAVYYNIPRDRIVDSKEDVEQEERLIRTPYIGSINFGVAVPTKEAKNIGDGQTFESVKEVMEAKDFYNYKFIMQIATGQYIACKKDILEYAFLRVLLFNMGRKIPIDNMRRHVLIHGMRLPLCPKELIQWTVDNRKMIEYKWLNRSEREKEKSEEREKILEKRRQRKLLFGNENPEIQQLQNRYKKNGNIMEMFRRINSTPVVNKPPEEINPSTDTMKTQTTPSSKSPSHGTPQKHPRTPTPAVTSYSTKSNEKIFEEILDAMQTNKLPELLRKDKKYLTASASKEFEKWLEENNLVDQDPMESVDDSDENDDNYDGGDFLQDGEENNKYSNVITEDADTDDEDVANELRLRQLARAKHELEETDDIMDETVEADIPADKKIYYKTGKKSKKMFKTVASGNKGKREIHEAPSDMDSEDDVVATGSMIDLAANSVLKTFEEGADEEDSKHDINDNNEEENNSSDNDSDFDNTNVIEEAKKKKKEKSKASMAEEKKAKRTKAEIQAEAQRKREEKERLKKEREEERLRKKKEKEEKAKEKEKEEKSKEKAKSPKKRKAEPSEDEKKTKKAKTETPKPKSTPKKSNITQIAKEISTAHIKELADAMHVSEESIVTSSNSMYELARKTCEEAWNKASTEGYESTMTDTERLIVRDAVQATYLMMRSPKFRSDCASVSELMANKRASMKRINRIAFDAVGDLWGMKCWKDVGKSEKEEESHDNEWE